MCQKMFRNECVRSRKEWNSPHNVHTKENEIFIAFIICVHKVNVQDSVEKIKSRSSAFYLNDRPKFFITSETDLFVTLWRTTKIICLLVFSLGVLWICMIIKVIKIIALSFINKGGWSFSEMTEMLSKFGDRCLTVMFSF